MPENWNTYKLDEISQIGSSKRIFRADYVEKGIPFYRSKEIIQKSFNENISDPLFISEQKYFEIKDKYGSPGNGDILISSVGNRSGIPYLVNNDGDFYFKDGNLLWFRNFNEEVYSPYLFQWLKSNIGQNLLLSSMIGSAQKALTIEGVKNLDIILPPLQEQKSIASILSALDDKIELNIQMNKTLEEMAMALYKHWFVDFEPFQDGEFVDSELGEIPKGWEVKPIGDVIETLGGGTPKTKVQEYWENGNIDWYSPTDLTKANSLFSFGTAKKITKKGLEKSSAKMFPPRSLLMSSRATIGAITINRKPACTNQGFITMIPNETLTLFQLHGWTVHNMNLILSKANGSTFKEISKANFRALPIVIGSGITAYIKEVENYYAQIENNLLENQTLNQLRDTLLPKLISGEVRVKDAEKTLKEIL